MSHTLVCLHGWGGSKESFTELRAALQGQDIQILTPDLPGFGDANDPPEPWTVDDYADWVEDWITKEQETRDPPSSASADYGRASKRQTFSLLGHSHGGRIAIKLAVRGTLPIEHLYLCAAAGIRRPKHLKRVIGLLLAKTGSLFLSIPGLKHLQPLGKKLLYRLVRVHDYEKANDVMRKTLIKVSQEDLRPLLPLITIPTDIFWGMEDRMTPLSDGKLMTRKIPGSHLHTFPNVRHGVHRDKAQEIARVIMDRLQK